MSLITRPKEYETYRSAAAADGFYFSSGLVVLQNRERVFAYNEAAAILWAALQGGASIEDLGDRLAQEYGLFLDRAREDARCIVDDWLSRGLIERCGTTEVRPRASDALPAQATAFPHRESEPPTPHLSTSWITLCSRRSISFSVEHPWLEALLRHQFPESDRADAERAMTVQIRCMPGNQLLLTIDGSERLRSTQTEEVLGQLIQELVEFLHPGREFLAFMHAGAVAREGRAYAFAAPSGSGKSTLVAYLKHNGYRYLSDDLVVISDPEGLVLPFPAPISIKPGSVSVLSPLYPSLAGASTFPSIKGDIRFIGPEENSTCSDADIPLHTLIFPQYDPTRRSELLSVSPLDALARLLADKIWLGYPITPTKVKSFLYWLEGIPSYSLRFSDLNESGLLLDRLAGE
jgi:hypothetical protein